MQRFLSAAILVLLWCSPSFGVVVPNTRVAFEHLADQSIAPFQYRATVQQEADVDNITSVWFAMNLLSLYPYSWHLDEGSDWYLVPFGATLTLESIQSGQFQPLLAMGTSSNVPPPSTTDFYLGIATSTMYFDPVRGGYYFLPRTTFGWVHLQWQDDFTFKMIGNAMAYGEGGIIVGTTTAVPEPTPIVAGLFVCIAANFIRSRGRESRGFCPKRGKVRIPV